MMRDTLPKLGKAGEAYLEGCGYLDDYLSEALPMPHLMALAERSAAAVEEVEIKLQSSGAMRDLNRAYREARLSGETKLLYGAYRKAKIIEMARALGLATIRKAGRVLIHSR